MGTHAAARLSAVTTTCVSSGRRMSRAVPSAPVGSKTGKGPQALGHEQTTAPGTGCPSPSTTVTSRDVADSIGAAVRSSSSSETARGRIVGSAGSEDGAAAGGSSPRRGLRLGGAAGSEIPMDHGRRTSPRPRSHPRSGGRGRRRSASSCGDHRKLDGRMRRRRVAEAPSGGPIGPLVHFFCDSRPVASPDAEASCGWRRPRGCARSCARGDDETARRGASRLGPHGTSPRLKVVRLARSEQPSVEEAWTKRDEDLARLPRRAGPGP